MEHCGGVGKESVAHLQSGCQAILGYFFFKELGFVKVANGKAPNSSLRKL
jgi:hypothetical protein